MSEITATVEAPLSARELAGEGAVIAFSCDDAPWERWKTRRDVLLRHRGDQLGFRDVLSYNETSMHGFLAWISLHALVL